MTRLKPQCRDFANPRHLMDTLNQAMPPSKRCELGKRTGYDYGAHKIFFQPYFRALILRECTGRASLTDLTDATRHDPLYRVHGAHMEVSTSAFSQANANRPLEPFLMILQAVLGAIGRLPSSAKVLRDVDSKTLRGIADLLTQTSIFDATTLSLPPKIADWAKTSEDQAGIKVQLRLQAGYGGLDKVMITGAAGNDNPYFSLLLDLEEDAHRIYLFDAGYFNIARYEEITDSGNFFVTTLHSNIHFEVAETRPVPGQIGPSGYTIHHDWMVCLGEGERRTEARYRVLEVTDSQGHYTSILTNMLEESAERICLLRRYRWTVETVVRWLKKQLHLDHLISYSPKGVILQVVIALIVYGLLVLYHQGGPFSLVRLRRRIKNDLHQALIDYGYQLGLREGLKLASGTSPPVLPT